MRRHRFGELRGTAGIEIEDGYGDDNEIVTDAPLADLPRLRFRRHGPMAREVTGGRFEIHATARGGVQIFAAQPKPRVVIGPGTRLNADLRLWRDASVSIGANTTVNQARMVADNSDIVIGPDCMFSDDILVQSADQHGLIDLGTLEFTNSHRRRIAIGEHVWVGRRSIVMPDVEIGAGSVVGTGSIVTKDAPACCYLVGVPARPVREGASWTRLPRKASERESAFFERMRAPGGPLGAGGGAA